MNRARRRSRRRRPWCRRRLHGSIARSVFYDWSLIRRRRRRRLQVSHGIENGVEDMRIDDDLDLSDLGHAILRRVVRLFNHDTPLLDRLGPVLFKHAFSDDPFVTRPPDRLAENAAVVGISRRSARKKSTEINTHLSATVWYSLSGRSSGWGDSMAGRGLPGIIDVGKGGGASFSFSFSALAGSGSGSGADAGVADLAGGLVCLLFAACSARAAARAGSFLFFSIGTASRTGCAQLVVACHVLIEMPEKLREFVWPRAVGPN